MSVVPPPNPNVDRFNNTYWTSLDAGSLSIAELETYFLTFPSAQGTENLLATNTLGQANFYADIAMIGTGNSITFPDNSVQTIAYTGGGGGDAYLAGGTLSVPQNFTGYNEFSNADGQITLLNTTDIGLGIQSINLSCDHSAYQLNVGGNLSIGNTANTNTIILSSSAAYTKQLDIAGYLNFQNTTNSNGIIIASDATNTNQLDIQGALSVGNSTNSNGIIIASDATNTNQLDIQGALSVGNSTNSNSILLASDTTTNNQLDISGNLVATNASITATQTYPQTTNTTQLATIGYVNGSVSTSLLGTNNTWSGTNAFSTTIPTTLTASTGDNSTSLATTAFVQTAVSGGPTLGGGTSGSPQNWTGYNNFSYFQSNGISAPLKFTSSSVTGNAGASQWNFTNFPTNTLGKGFTFAFSTNFTPTPPTFYYGTYSSLSIASTDSIINGIGIGTLQPYLVADFAGTYNAYVLSLTSYNGVSNLTIQTGINTQAPSPPVITLYLETTSSNYYYTNNISMTLYIYPQTVVN